MQGKSTKLVPIEKIEAHPSWTNYRGDVGDVRPLAESIGRNGLQNPLRVRTMSEQVGTSCRVRYYLAAGHRRFAAINLLLAGLDVVDPDGTKHRLQWEGPVPCSCVDLDEPLDLVFDNLVENIQREDPEPVALGRALAALQTQSGLTLAQIATRLGKSPDWAQARVAFIRNAAPEVLAAVEAGDLSEKLARDVVRAAPTDPKRQAALTELAAAPARAAKTAVVAPAPRAIQKEARAAVAAAVPEAPAAKPIVVARRMTNAQIFAEITRWQGLRAQPNTRQDQARAVQVKLSGEGRLDAATAVIHGFTMAMMLVNGDRCACGEPMVDVTGMLPREHEMNTDRCG